ncbi:hypothetical protein CAC01_18600 [Streptomyces sp. CLI2509]|nr:hypothetical protein CAC01_18600 [Streptomyces sp. CLI2509]
MSPVVRAVCGAAGRRPAARGMTVRGTAMCEVAMRGTAMCEVAMCEVAMRGVALCGVAGFRASADTVASRVRGWSA